ncbi:DUF6745 domain-containing protein [Rhodopirellula sp. MGV]|uniref:DUF6745 domain-containing protein n=1 Tax=Rhodopirellula sp. MGV TaxID=2023130 RepID=UPI000B95DB7D|nr:hypothetical protein [Rhodopirellula sp. MGV]OYP36425.1 hypothetical protein CGZ80_08975 [Rhodopirellula sp. MGV]PNY36851.1 hypothetical protein C2E31_10880 [Rhodopirellula baltica]
MKTLSPEEARQHLLAEEKAAICVEGSIDLRQTKLSSIACRLQCNDLDLSGTPIESLPKSLKVRSRLTLDNCTSLQRLPKGLTCGSLSLRGCVFIDRLPEQLSTWFLNASGCPRLSSWPKEATIRNGNVNLRNCVEIRELPGWLGPLGQLDLGGCVNLHALPEGLQVSGWIDIGGSGIQSLPKSLANSPLRWRSVPITHQIAFEPDKITAKQVLDERNAELRRVMIERMGYLKFANDVEAKELDRDTDAGGQRQLLKIDIDEDEPLVGLVCNCPSTNRQYFLRVPPQMQTCHQAAAWMAGFDDPKRYRPVIET